MGVKFKSYSKVRPSRVGCYAPWTELGDKCFTEWVERWLTARLCDSMCIRSSVVHLRPS